MSASKRKKTAIWWVRRDLRLVDNQALTAAFEHSHALLPVFVLDPQLLSSPFTGEKRLAFLLAGLRQLDRELRQRGGRLILRMGNPVDELKKLVDESGADAIFAEADYSPYAHHRDEQVAQALPLKLTGGLTLHPPEAVLKADNTPYTVFTPYSRKWKILPPPLAQSVLPSPTRIDTPAGIESVPIPAKPNLPPAVPFAPGSAEAGRRLQAFADSLEAPIYQYHQQRDRMDLEGTSQLSPYLRFGMLSARQAMVAAYSAVRYAPSAEAQKGAESWLNELIWREFYIAILYHFPQVLGESFRPNLQSIRWENDELAFEAWRAGRTGYPVVDAAMRQLSQIGWMHNRARMIVASFLVKDLLIDWRWGAHWFMQQLVDGDPAANNGGWQWSAGTGTDAAPYFRIFNPVTQSTKFDPSGAYIQRWVPELALVPDKYIHQPWTMPAEVQQVANCMVGQDYPQPIVDHKWARERTLAVYGRAKDAALRANK